MEMAIDLSDRIAVHTRARVHTHIRV